MTAQENSMSTVASTPTPITTGSTDALLSLTDAAIAKVKYFAGTMADSEGKPLRIFVQGGGCSGFQYGFTFDEKKEGDTVIAQGGIEIVVDPQSATYLKDAKVDFIEDMRGAGFSVTNPNASGGCGCGKSFNA
jgi:iron-sulfur cluster insertion protein